MYNKLLSTSMIRDLLKDRNLRIVAEEIDVPYNKLRQFVAIEGLISRNISFLLKLSDYLITQSLRIKLEISKIDYIEQ